MDVYCLLPSLTRLPAIGQALVGIIGSTVIAGCSATILTSNVARPEPANVVAIDPSNAFAKPLQVHDHRVTAQRSLERCLTKFQRKNTVNQQTQASKSKGLGKNHSSLFTLYHMNNLLEGRL